MPTHILGNNNPDCPLCKKPFEAAVAQGVKYYFCRKDKIQIMAHDPMLLKQSNIDPETGEEVPCTNQACGEGMNIFTRSDGYMKAVCPGKRCGAEIESEQIPDAEMVVEKGKGIEGTDGISKKGLYAKDNWLGRN
jgi:hypothetical protein